MSTEARLSSAILLAVASLSTDAAEPRAQVVYSAGSQPAFSGPDQYFSGQVDVQVLFPEQAGVPYSGAYVTFQPGARTAWHQHPAGQHMVVTRGKAITATRDGQVVAFDEGETVWCPEGVDHWHGTLPHSAMTHLVITGSRDGKNVVWKEKVTDAQYQAAVAAATAGMPALTALSLRHQQLAVVAATAAAGDLATLNVVLNQALDGGVAINELKESLIHLYPYGGFPKSLNALATLMAVVNARQGGAHSDRVGDAPASLPEGEQALALGQQVQTELVGHPVSGPLFDFAPGINTFLQKHLFGDVFARGVLSHQDREVLTVAMLAAMTGTDGQLQAHFGMAANTGITNAQLQDLATLLEHRVSHRIGQRIAQGIAGAPSQP